MDSMATIKFKPEKKVAYDKTPLQLKVSPGVREKIKGISGWQEILRGFLDQMIAANEKLPQIKQD
ncbi:hypothetical protein [Nostoc sp. NOS(2021)]|uniref:hypothetical protein n=1 Tax=Nostoc sp. NOS(2021) TaxID=2815407 RepID=UPI0025CBF86A|nr:hypothetical protein [Nostoc sp. NOS(2021)]